MNRARICTRLAYVLSVVAVITLSPRRLAADEAASPPRRHSLLAFLLEVVTAGHPEKAPHSGPQLIAVEAQRPGVKPGGTAFTSRASDRAMPRCPLL